MLVFKQELAVFGVKQKIAILSSVNEGERPFKGISAMCHFVTPVSNLIDGHLESSEVFPCLALLH